VKKLRLLLGTLLAGPAAMATVSVSAATPEIWLGPVDPVTVAARKWNASADYMDLFRSDSGWKTVAGSIHVFKIGPGFVQQGTEADLRLIFSELKKRNIKLALEIGMATRSEHCNQSTEAYGAPGLVEGLLGRVKRLGGELNYIAMDEPLYYGHEFKGGGACSLTVRQVAADVAPNVKLAKSLFPNVEIGDVEVAGLSTDFLHATEEWVDAYREAVGFNLAFLHTDVGWSLASMKNLVPLAEFVRSRSVKFGVIYNGNANDDTDEAWARGTIEHFNYIESGLGLIPDQAIFHTWVPFPTRNLPESQFGTLTNLVIQYLRPRSVLTLRHDGTNFQGRLTDLNGKPIGAAPVSLVAVGAVSDKPAEVKRLTGKVFLKATEAMMVVRANKELQCGGCQGAATAIIGKSRYYEEDNRNVQEIPGARIDVDAHGSVYENSREFPVTPGATFTLEVPYSARIGTEHAAYVAVLFVDDQGHEVGRRFLYLESLGFPVSTAVTGLDGAFRFNVDRTIAAARPQEFEAQFSGSDRYRGAAAVVQ